MNLVFIYGPPAVGKLTVAQELSKITNYKIFHNHLTLDIAQSIFEWGTGNFWSLVRKLRLCVIMEVAKSNEPGMIFTFVYNGTEEEDKFISKITKSLKRNGGKTFFIHLVSDEKTLKKRVMNPARKKYLKISSVKILNESLSNMSQKNINLKPHILIDNSKTTAKQTSEKIRKFIMN